MKNYLYFIPCLTALLFSSATIANGLALDLRGQVTVETCGVLESDEYKYVDLGIYAAKDLAQLGRKTGSVPIPFHLMNCGSEIPISIKFEGEADPNDLELLKIKAVRNSATNVAIEMLDENKKRLPLGAKSYHVSDIDGEIHTLFYAHYIVTKERSTPGKANATAQFSIEYE